jgi:prevent-host-death family protein
VTTHEAKTQLSRLLAEVEAGEEIVIRRGNTPVAKLTAVKARSKRTRPRVGTLTSGPVRWSTDAFAPLSEDDLKTWGL